MKERPLTAKAVSGLSFGKRVINGWRLEAHEDLERQRSSEQQEFLPLTRPLALQVLL